MVMLVDCSQCRTPLQLPHGAKSIRCAVCHAITLIGEPRNAPPTPPPPYFPPPTTYSSNNYNYYAPPPPPIPAPSQYNHAPPSQPPSAHGRKKAVLIGISYKNSRNELKGCINDAN